MPRFTAADVRLERWSRTPLFVPDHALCQAAKTALEAHFLAEWNDDIEATMATIHPDEPWQRVPALGLDVRGTDAVRDYYLKRFATWPGPVMEGFDRVTIGPDVILVEGTLAPPPGAVVAALAGPAVVVVDIRDGLILGETVHASRTAEPVP